MMPPPLMYFACLQPNLNEKLIFVLKKYIFHVRRDSKLKVVKSHLIDDEPLNFVKFKGCKKPRV